MNTQQYYDEQGQREEGKAAVERSGPGHTAAHVRGKEETVIPVIQEEAVIEKKTVETGRINIDKSVVEVEEKINIPLLQEDYDIKRVPVNQIVSTAPAVRQEGDITIVPVVREVLVVEKRLELVEEIHIQKRASTIEHKETVLLRKEEVTVNRTPTGHGKDQMTSSE